MGVDHQRIALFNVTDIVDSNPGCQATVKGLRKAISREFIYQLPLGYGYHYFEGSKVIDRILKPSFSKVHARVSSDKNYRWLLKFVDIIVINAEGTIHSDSVGARTLLSFARLAKEMRKKVYIVNGSYYNLSAELIEILKTCDALYVREKASMNYLETNGVNALLVPDCAFLNDFQQAEKEKKTLYTPGVLFNYGKEKQGKDLNQILKSHFSIISEKGQTPSFLQIEPKEQKLAEFWKGLGGNVINSAELSVNELLHEISKFDTVISGRYHILLFALMVNAKTIPLTSNSKKINGLYKTFGSLEVEPQDVFNQHISIDNTVELQLDLNQIQETIKASYAKLF